MLVTPQGTPRAINSTATFGASAGTYLRAAIVALNGRAALLSPWRVPGGITPGTTRSPASQVEPSSFNTPGDVNRRAMDSF
jgi:hypothetical protein